MSDTLAEMDKYYKSLSSNELLRLAQAKEAFNKEQVILLQETIHAILYLLLENNELTLDGIVGQILIDRGYGQEVVDRDAASRRLKEQQAIQQLVFVAINAMSYIKDIEQKKGRKYALTALGEEKAKSVPKRSS